MLMNLPYLGLLSVRLACGWWYGRGSGGGEVANPKIWQLPSPSDPLPQGEGECLRQEVSAGKFYVQRPVRFSTGSPVAEGVIYLRSCSHPPPWCPRPPPYPRPRPSSSHHPGQIMQPDRVLLTIKSNAIDSLMDLFIASSFRWIARHE
jgi:hypothetical protein